MTNKAIKYQVSILPVLPDTYPSDALRRYLTSRRTGTAKAWRPKQSSWSLRGTVPAKSSAPIPPAT